jgi:hypothetical protein
MLAFVAAVIIVFVLAYPGISQMVGLLIFAYLVIWKGTVLGVVAGVFHKRQANNEFLVHFIGRYHGRFSGMLLGGMSGAKLAAGFHQSAALGGLIGALLLYIGGRSIGPKVSLFVSKLLDTKFVIKRTPAHPKQPKGPSYLPYMIVASVASLPILFTIIGLSADRWGIHINDYSHYLPAARIIGTVLSLYALSFPWMINQGWLLKARPVAIPRQEAMYVLGLTFSVVPALYGFILFFAFGATRIEFLVFEAAAMLAIVVWLRSHPIPRASDLATHPHQESSGN